MVTTFRTEFCRRHQSKALKKHCPTCTWMICPVYKCDQMYDPASDHWKGDDRDDPAAS